MAMSALETIVAPDFASMSVCKATIITLETRQLIIKLAPVLTGGASASTTVTGTMSLPLTSAESAPATIISSGSPSTPIKPIPAVNILEYLIIWVIDQFLSVMEYCTDLVLTGQSSFDFVRSLLDNHVQNIKKVGRVERAMEYQAHAKQMRQCLADLHNLENANVTDTAQLILANMRAEQSRL